jgi:hypothetical protein
MPTTDRLLRLIIGPGRPGSPSLLERYHNHETCEMPDNCGHCILLKEYNLPPTWTWESPPRRGIDWEIAGAKGELAIQKIDCADGDDRDTVFISDDEAAAFVLWAATDPDCPALEVRVEGRMAVLELVQCWIEEAKYNEDGLLEEWNRFQETQKASA